MIKALNSPAIVTADRMVATSIACEDTSGTDFH